MSEARDVILINVLCWKSWIHEGTLAMSSPSVGMLGS